MALRTRGNPARQRHTRSRAALARRPIRHAKIVSSRKGVTRTESDPNLMRWRLALPAAPNELPRPRGWRRYDPLNRQESPFSTGAPSTFGRGAVARLAQMARVGEQQRLAVAGARTWSSAHRLCALPEISKKGGLDLPVDPRPWPGTTPDSRADSAPRSTPQDRAYRRGRRGAALRYRPDYPAAARCAP